MNSMDDGPSFAASLHVKPNVVCLVPLTSRIWTINHYRGVPIGSAGEVKFAMLQRNVCNSGYIAR